MAIIETNVGAPDATPTPPQNAPVVSRRRLLQAAGDVVVVAVAGTLYRAYDQGVFSTGQGPGYDAWRDWDDTGGGVQLALVRAAILATNAHNTQPWLFRLSTDRIGLFAVLERNIGTIDSLRREMCISLGCALENLSLAAVAHGFTPAVQITPDPTDQTFAARIDLSPSQTPIPTPYAAIPARQTNRAAYAARSAAEETLKAMETLIDVTNVALVWLTSSEDKRTFSDLTLRATEAIIAGPAPAALRQLRDSPFLHDEEAYGWVLMFGSEGAGVRRLQNDLRSLGFDPGPIDGRFGWRTEPRSRLFRPLMACSRTASSGPEQLAR